MKPVRDLDAALLRAYSEARCMDYGCAAEDVHELRERVRQGETWCDVACDLGSRKGVVGDALAAHPQWRAQASMAYLQSSACLRVGQTAQESSIGQRLPIYERMSAAFASAMRLADVPARSLPVRWNRADHQAWLFVHPDATRWVVVWGGADGWCEAYHRSVQVFRERGLSVCLVELPGQGLARLREGSCLREDFSEFVSQVLDLLQAMTTGSASFGVVGHSLGGALALRAAADDQRISACVTNGGSVYMERGFAAWPRVLGRFARMLGEAVDGPDALAFIKRLSLGEAATRMHADLLCLHGGRDELVKDDEVQELIRLHGRATLRIWAESSHCIYDHANERNQVMADWLAGALA